MLTFILLGIIQGAVIGLMAIGIVLVYKGSRVFNFAQAEFGTTAAFLLFFFFEGMDLPYGVALVLSLIGIALIGLIFERLIIRPLFNAPRVTLLVATAGFALLAISLQLILGKPEIHTLEPAIPGNAFTLFGTNVSNQQLLSLGVFGALAAGLAYFFNKTDLGLAVLATSQEAVATELVGIGTKRMSSFIWTFAAVLGGIGGILQAPDTTFVAGFMTLQGNYLLLGFTAAILGGVTSLAGAFVGGQIIGIVLQLGSYVDNRWLKDLTSGLSGVPDLIIFILLLTVLLLRPKGLLGKEA